MDETRRMSGGWRGMNGTQRRIMLGAVGLFLLIVVVIMIANAESTLSDLAANGVHIRPDLVWSWEWTSMIGWLSVYPLLWIAVARIRPPRVSWPVVAVALVLGSLAASGWHIGVMVALRHIYYDAVGSGPYRFFGVIPERLLYEYRKDVATYLQFVALAAIVQWLIARAATPPAAPPHALAIADGAVTHHVPVDEIEWVASAGNYVEIGWRARTLLHRATLSATEESLGPEFVRIHRGRLVRRAAIRRVESERSGDFTVTLESGAELRGSRRYRLS
ncbi:LytTR family DNA-binding domain-containing protein [Sphingomonas sp. DT-204]|uniref:LytTR family DNA-binding domain-containing protein n=1 Tax=Sphingomonas sp. DT-204 TaxID=3396166 RepID=UPI003F1CE0FC